MDRSKNMKKVLVSSCLLGMNCRYNGERKAKNEVLALLKREDLMLIPVCPEQMGGLSTPRIPSEILDGHVMNREGMDVTDFYNRGAEDVCRMAELYGCSAALLKERSPSCGSGEIYDGSFSHRLILGDGIAAAALKKIGIPVYGESQLKQLFAELGLE